MATITAIQTGNWSDPATWPGGVLPGPADDVWTGAYIVTIDQDISVNSLNNTNGSSAYFSVIGSVTIDVAEAVYGRDSSDYCLRVNLTAGQTSTLNGNIAPSGNIANCIAVEGSGTFIVNGDINNAGNSSRGLYISGPARVEVNGTVTAVIQLSFGTAPPVQVDHDNAELYVTGTLEASGTAGGSKYFTPPLVVTKGKCYFVGNGTITTTGEGFTNTFLAILVTIVNGDFFLTGNLSINSIENGVLVNHTGTLGGFHFEAGALAKNANGRFPFACRRMTAGGSGAVTFGADYLISGFPTGQRTFYSADNLPGIPAASDVRLGTTFGPSDELTGTMAVPPEAAVGFGVPVDATTGTAAVSPLDFWGVQTTALVEPGSIGARAKNAASVEAVGAILAGLLNAPQE